MNSLPDRFEYVDALGQTSPSARVGRFLDVEQSVHVAVKQVVPGELVAKRFTRETRATLSAAGRHIMPILDHDDGGQWYSMPLAKAELQLPSSSSSECERAELALQVVEALAEALRDFHRLGQVHRDLKPQNILWLEEGDGGGRWVVADFGIARNAPGSTTSALTRDGNLVGTEGWAASEQYLDAHLATPQTDVYSAGALISWVMTRKVPVPGRVEIPKGRYGAAVRRATAHDKRDRFAGLDELLETMRDDTGRRLGQMSQQLEQVFAKPIQFSSLSNFILGNLDDIPRVAPRLGAIEPGDIGNWFATDHFGLSEVAMLVAKWLKSLTGVEVGTVVSAIEAATLSDYFRGVLESAFGRYASVELRDWAT